MLVSFHVRTVDSRLKDTERRARDTYYKLPPYKGHVRMYILRNQNGVLRIVLTHFCFILYFCECTYVVPLASYSPGRFQMTVNLYYGTAPLCKRPFAVEGKITNNMGLIPVIDFNQW